VGRFEWDGKRNQLKHSIKILASVPSESKWIVAAGRGSGNGVFFPRGGVAPDCALSATDKRPSQDKGFHRS